MRRILIVISIFGAMAIATPSSYAGVDVNINIGVPLPPPVVVQAPPEMMIIPEAGVYVAVGTPYDLFFLSGRYYYFHNGYWYWARGYGGPWVHVESRTLPPGLRRYKIERLHEFREHAWKDYRERGPAYRRKHFRAEEREIAKERHKKTRERGEPDRNTRERERGEPDRHGER